MPELAGNVAFRIMRTNSLPSRNDPNKMSIEAHGFPSWLCTAAQARATARGGSLRQLVINPIVASQDD